MTSHRYHLEHRDAYGKLVQTWVGVTTHKDAQRRVTAMVGAMFLGDVVSVALVEPEGARVFRVET